MKNKSFIIYTIVLIAVIAGAYYGYNYLSENYQPETVQTQETEQQLQPAPDFTVFDDNGNEVNLSDFKGRHTVVNFWATWCGPCISELPYFDNMYAKYKDEVDVLMVNMTDGQQETVEGVQAFIAENGYTFPVFYDTEYSAAQTYGVNSIPLTLFIDAQGNLAGYHMGAMQEDALESYFQQLIALGG